MQVPQRLLLLGVALLVFGCSRGEPEASPTSTAPTTTSSTTTTSTTVAPPPPPVVVALGDSNLFEAGDELAVQLPGAELRTHAVIGMKTSEGHFGFAELAAAEPDVILVVLGTNDALDGDVTAQDLTSLDELATSVSTVPCVRWVDVATSGRAPETGARWNEALEEASQRHGFGIVRWSEDLAAHPEWMREDGLHFTEAGQQAFAATLAGAVQGCLAQLPAQELLPERGEGA